MLSLSKSAYRRPLLLVRNYSVIPSIPQPVTPTAATTAIKNPNDISHEYHHALYNNENQSMHDHLLPKPQKATYRSLSSDDHQDTSSFGPTFNSVFDE